MKTARFTASLLFNEAGKMSIYLHKRFATGFLAGLGLCSMANYLSFYRMRWGEANCECADFTWAFGFPFDVHIHGGFSGIDTTIWSGVFVNALMALFVGISLGYLFSGKSGVRSLR